MPFDERHLSVLSLDDISIDLFLAENPSATPGAFELKGRGHRLNYAAQPDEFIDVCVRVLNDSREFCAPTRDADMEIADFWFAHLSATPQALKLRLDLHSPAGSAHSLAHLARYVIIEGVSPIALPLLEPGESHEERISVCLLAKGRYEFGCVVQATVGTSPGPQSQSQRKWEAGERIVVEV